MHLQVTVADPGEGAPVIFRPNGGPKGRKEIIWIILDPPLSYT